MFIRRQGRINQQVGQVGSAGRDDPCRPSLRDMINDPARHLFHFMVLDETHALIFGSIGTGKTTLIKNALMSVPCDYAVVVFDAAGTYEGYTDYYAPYPLNPLDYLSDIEALDVIEEVLTMRFPRLPYVMTPAMEYMFMRAYGELTGQADDQLGNQPIPQAVSDRGRAVGEVSISGLIKHLNDLVSGGALAREDEVNSARGLIRRLTYFNHWLFGRTHPLINRLINGGLRGKSIGIDLSWFSPVQRWFYVLSLLAILNSMQARDLILVIDEAHLYFRLGESTLTTSVRVGRNYGRYFALITQSPFDIPREFISMNKLFIEFPTLYFNPENIIFREPGFKAHYGRDVYYNAEKTWSAIPPAHWENPLTAVMHIHITNRQMRNEHREPYNLLTVEVDPTIKPKTGTTTLRKCAEAHGVRLDVIRESGFTDAKMKDRLEGVWECVGRP
ncbi:type IV secretion system DNA-binding domain-containing protein [Vulcanisaeta distributa]|uniref:Type IV secretion system coupling protein TraD DNA-binding domain-containing protein n=1 Tax=Vulcanisaeta distributa (strain DSM 14429 / JCM 11212 / NBRC 100878 / IC-017) TaxID=572478 RepID=E1QSN0_VULDI|nr:type IV secretion system DNA-binding domain-containing protein [Vulcanisaeta distributa]ADN49547.1 hypothetical protein Vdis_0134 [Vulcanisaeta distributa DSM 14429]